MKYISQPPLLLDVHIHKPLLPARTWMDSLLAFFPGLQVRVDHMNLSYYSPCISACRFSNVVHSVHTVHVSGAEGRYPSCHRDSWDAVSSYKETQLPPRGKLSLRVSDLKYHILGFNYSTKKWLGVIWPRSRVTPCGLCCQPHLFGSEQACISRDTAAF